jgi:ribosomal RNA-processing protein 12
MDLVLILLPNLEPNFSGPIELYYKVCVGQLASTDSTLQKKTYKSILHIVQHVTLASIDETDLATRLIEEDIQNSVSTSATRQRVQLVQFIVENTKKKQLLLSFIPRVLSAIMLATKEASEKTRDTAYQCLVAMARKMMSGSDAMYVQGIDEAMNTMELERESIQDAEGDEVMAEHKGEISIREFMLMVSAGLDSDSSHVQSAAIASMGRLMFEFSGISF